MHPSCAQATPADLVADALEKKLDVIAVTDHNNVDWCDPMREAAAGSRLVVLPGIEISTSEGHLLAIFDPEKLSLEVREFLVQIGIREKDFGNLEAIASLNFTDTAKAVEAEGGLAIAAHVERERGFLQMVKTGARRREIQAQPEIRAFEVVDPGLRERYGRGSVAGRRGAIACVQGSDSWPPGGDRHHLDAVGTRHCRIKMDDVSVWALRQATFDPELRIQFATDPTQTPVMVIEGVWVSGGFLGGQKLRFSDDISCLIGDTGSGKSLTIELMRFALDQQVDPVLPKIREEVHKLLSFALRDMDTVYVLVRRDGQRYVIERPWVAGGSPAPVVYRVNGDNVEPLSGDPIHIPSFLPIKGYSQSEIIEYAREPLARLSLIDVLIDISVDRDVLIKAKADLRRNAADLTQLQRERERRGAAPGLARSQRGDRTVLHVCREHGIANAGDMAAGAIDFRGVPGRAP
jgi:hypothetical protein